MNKPVESISAETTSWLTNSDWLGNVRQLENLIERSVALTNGVALQGFTRWAAVIVGSLKPVSRGQFCTRSRSRQKIPSADVSTSAERIAS
jgi:DNA-binding NtrC family response regulator